MKKHPDWTFLKADTGFRVALHNPGFDDDEKFRIEPIIAWAVQNFDEVDEDGDIVEDHAGECFPIVVSEGRLGGTMEDVFWIIYPDGSVSVPRQSDYNEKKETPLKTLTEQLLAHLQAEQSD